MFSDQSPMRGTCFKHEQKIIADTIYNELNICPRALNKLTCLNLLRKNIGNDVLVVSSDGQLGRVLQRRFCILVFATSRLCAKLPNASSASPRSSTEYYYTHNL